MHGGLIKKAASDARVGHPWRMLQLAAIHLDVGRGGREAFQNFLLGKGVYRRKAAIVADLIECTTGAGGLEDLSGLAQRRRHRLLREDVDVTLQGREHCLGMQSVGGTDINRLDASIQKRLGTGEGTSADQPCQLFCLVRDHICHADDLHAPVQHQVFGVHCADVASADDPDFKSHDASCYPAASATSVCSSPLNVRPVTAYITPIAPNTTAISSTE